MREMEQFLHIFFFFSINTCLQVFAYNILHIFEIFILAFIKQVFLCVLVEYSYRYIDVFLYILRERLAYEHLMIDTQGFQ